MSQAAFTPPPGHDVPVLDIDPYSEAVLADPYAFFEVLREAGPVVWIPAHGVYATGRYAQVKEVFTNFASFTAESGVGLQDARDPSANARPKSMLTETDPPAHTANRRAANRILSPLIIRQFRDVFAARAAEVVEAALARGGACDGVADLVEALVLTAFPRAMGLRHNPEAVKAIGYMSFNQTGPKNALHRKGLKAGEPWLDWFHESCRRENVTPGSLAEEFFRYEAAGEVVPGFAENVIRSMVRGGVDSTMAGISYTLYQLARNPAQWALLQQNPGRRRQAFDEAIRHESPFYVVYRATTGNVSLDGRALKDHAKIGMYPGAANRDPRQWERPDEFDIMRDTAGIHMSFGTAEHNCLGQNIARLEADCLLEALMDRVARIELVGAPAYNLHNQLRTLGQLPLRLVAR